MHFLVGDERAVHALRITAAGRQVEHVALAEQCFRAHLVEDSARVDLARHLERHARRHVGLDQTGDDVDRGALRRQHQMNAGGARLLRQTRDQLFHLLADHHHQIGQLVDKYHDEGQLLQRFGMLRREGEGVGERLSGLDRVAHFLVVARHVAHAEAGHQAVAFVHFLHAPVEACSRLAHVGDHRCQQMRDAFIHRQFQHLGVDQQQAHFLRRGLVQQAQDKCVDRDRLARAGGAGHQHMRHLGQIGHHRLAGNILAQHHGQRRFHVGIDLRTEYLRQAHGLALRIGQFQRHAVFAGNGFHHAQAHHRQRARQVFHQVGDLAALYADGGLDLVAGDDGPRIGRHHFDFHAEVLQLALDQARGEFQRVVGNGFNFRGGLIQQMQGRQRGVRNLAEQRGLLFLHHAGGFDDF